MIRRIAKAALLMALAGCAGPQFDSLGGTDRSAEEDAYILVEPAPEAPVATAPVIPDASCDDPGDGIGGTGCSVD